MILAIYIISFLLLVTIIMFTIILRKTLKNNKEKTVSKIVTEIIKSDEIASSIKEALQEVVDNNSLTALESIIEEPKKKQSTSCIVKITEESVLLDDLLETYRLKANAQCCFYLAFHNGEYYTDGSSLLKFSIKARATCCGCSLSTQPVLSYPVAPYNKAFLKIISKDVVHKIHKDAKDIGIGYPVFMNTLSSNLHVSQTVKNTLGEVVGIFVVGYSEKENQIISNEEYIRMKNEVQTQIFFDS